MVKRHFQEQTHAGYAMSIIEAEKILKLCLQESGFPGKTTKQKIKSAKPVFIHYQDLQSARNIYTHIIEDPEAEVTQDEASRALRAYYQAISDLQEKEEAQLTRVDRLMLKARSFFSHITISWKKLTAGSILALVAILLLGKTQIGLVVSSAAVRMAEIFMKGIIAVGISAFGIILIIRGAMYYLQNRKHKKGLVIEE